MDAFWGFWASAAQAAHAGVPEVSASEPAHKRAKTDKDVGIVSLPIQPPTLQQQQHAQHPFIAPAPQPLSWGHTTAVTAAATAAAVTLAPNPGFPDITTSISPLIHATEEPEEKTDVKIIQRRKRNAFHSRATRVRKKNLELELCLELRALQNENDRLRAIVKREIPEKEAFIIGECCYTTGGKGLFQGDHSSRLGRSDFELIESLAKGRESYVLTDPRLPDNPIVYASCAFLELTGYSLEDVIGRNCRFLQGIHTDHKEVETIREAIDNGIDGSVCILNYKADGSPFWNHLFVAALRDKDNNIVNYVGVQNEVKKNIAAEPKTSLSHVDSQNDVTSIAPATPNNEVLSNGAVQTKDKLSPKAAPTMPSRVSVPPLHQSSSISSSQDIPVQDLDKFDWTELAELFEAEYEDDDGDLTEFSCYPGNDEKINEDETSIISADKNESYLFQFFLCPRRFVTRTVRSEIIESLLQTNGDVTDSRFLAALGVLSNIFKSTNQDNVALSAVLNGSWKSISRPPYHYGGCLGTNERGEFVYTLGKMCFNMFTPGSLRCTIQNTMNHIAPVCTMDMAPANAPWSLRRELALQDPERSMVQPDTTLKSYDIVIALTLEPGQFNAKPNEIIPSPHCRLRATHVVRGYFLPDPSTPNRLTVWFTGGQLAPASPPSNGSESTESEYGTQKDWIDLFTTEHKRTWSESISVMGAKVFLGAELPQKMEPDGSMSYSLHRPYGGHGKGFVDVMYVDHELLITKGNTGTIHVMVRPPEASSSSTSPPTESVEFYSSSKGPETT